MLRRAVGAAPPLLASWRRLSQQQQQQRVVLCATRTCFYKKRVYRSRFSEFFFTELDKGFNSAWFCGVFFVFCGGMTYFMYIYWLVPNMEAGRLKHRSGFQLRTPYADSHNAFWNFKPAVPDYRHPASLEALDEDIVRQPGLIATVESEFLGPDGLPKTIFVMETQELDPKHQDDVFYRSVHYVNKSETTRAPSSGDDKSRKQKARRGSLILGAVDEEQEKHIHALVKCRTVTSENQCVPETQAVPEERTRKMMLGIVPANAQKDAAATILRWRFTMAGQIKSRVLICGLRGGTLARTLNTAFPQFDIDVCEPDGGLVRVNRQFLGVKEYNNLRIFISDFQTYLRDCALKKIQYNLIFLDCEDPRGRIPPFLGRLEFINQLRSVMSAQGTIVFNIPNSRKRELLAMIENWRIGFANQPLTLVHCENERNTILMAFNDGGDFGQQQIGTLSDPETFKQLYLAQRDQFNRSMDIDLAAEISNRNFQIIEPHVPRYDLLLAFDEEASGGGDQSSFFSSREAMQAQPQSVPEEIADLFMGKDSSPPPAPSVAQEGGSGGGSSWSRKIRGWFGGR